VITRKRKLRFVFKDRATTIEGTLVRQTRRDYIIEMPRMARGADEWEELVGPIEIPREQILFKQVTN